MSKMHLALPVVAATLALVWNADAQDTSAFTFTSDEPGVEVSERSADSRHYANLCTTPCILQLAMGPHRLEFGGRETNVVATGAPQEWRYDSAENANWGWGVAGTVLGTLALVSGIVFATSSEDASVSCGPWCWLPEDFYLYVGLGAVGLGALLLGLGIWGIVASEPVSNVTATGNPAGESTSEAFALVPSVGPMRTNDGRTAWGFSLALSL